MRPRVANPNHEVSMTRALSDALAARLRDEANIPASGYARCPATAKLAFLLSIPPNKKVEQREIKLWITEDAEVTDFFPNPEEQTVAMVVHEPARDFVEEIARVSVETDWLNPLKNKSKIKKTGTVFNAADLPKDKINWLRQQSRFSIPNETVNFLSCEVIEEEERYYNYAKGRYDTRKIYRVGKIKIRHAAPEATHFLFMGKDETHPFISMLPERPTSWQHAIDQLRPEISNDHVRVGEWFFERVSNPAEVEALNAAFTEQLRTKTYQRRHQQLENRSSHMVTSHMRSKALGKMEDYACGFVYDVRRGRHDTIFLDSWHRVVRNGEVNLQSDPTNFERPERSRYWD